MNFLTTWLDSRIAKHCEVQSRYTRELIRNEILEDLQSKIEGLTADRVRELLTQEETPREYRHYHVRYARDINEVIIRAVAKQLQSKIDEKAATMARAMVESDGYMEQLVSRIRAVQLHD